MSFQADAENPRTGVFVLIDRFSGATVGAGRLRFALRRARNVVWQDLKVDKAQRARAIGQRPCVLWLTGLPAAGKSTIADRVEQKLQAMGRRTYLLDGDNVRHGLSRDLGFTDRDRVENIRRVAEVAKLMVDAGLIVIVSFISPFRSEREMARALMEEGEFAEIFVDTPLDVCEARDPKGLYAKARGGALVNFTRHRFALRAPREPRSAHRHDRAFSRRGGGRGITGVVGERVRSCNDGFPCLVREKGLAGAVVRKGIAGFVPNNHRLEKP